MRYGSGGEEYAAVKNANLTNVMPMLYVSVYIPEA